jgi:hypothetical protein
MARCYTRSVSVIIKGNEKSENLQVVRRQKQSFSEVERERQQRRCGCPSTEGGSDPVNDEPGPFFSIINTFCFTLLSLLFPSTEALQVLKPHCRRVQ